jgi:hypothetical protein
MRFKRQTYSVRSPWILALWVLVGGLIALALLATVGIVVAVGVVLGLIGLGLRRLGFRLRRPGWRRLTVYRSRNPWR